MDAGCYSSSIEVFRLNLDDWRQLILSIYTVWYRFYYSINVVVDIIFLLLPMKYMEAWNK